MRERIKNSVLVSLKKFKPLLSMTLLFLLYSWSMPNLYKIMCRMVGWNMDTSLFLHRHLKYYPYVAQYFFIIACVVNIILHIVFERKLKTSLEGENLYLKIVLLELLIVTYIFIFCIILFLVILWVPDVRM